MKKNKKIVLIFTLFCCILFIFLLLKNTDVEKERPFLAVVVDGITVNNYPEKGSYDVTVNCVNADGNWNYDLWTLYIDNISSDVSCNITFTSKAKTYLHSQITSLVNKTQGDGKVISENGYRYEGKNPNNYILFNNELWRIIGALDYNSHGVSGKYYTKIIRTTPIGAYSFDKSNINGWESNSGVKVGINLLLNEAYYNAQDGTGESYCYSGTISSKCDFTKIGIKDEFRGMIINAKWFLGGFSMYSSDTYYYSQAVANVYKYERTTQSNSNYKYAAYSYIGLIYRSDFRYAVLSDKCARTITYYGGGTYACLENNWMADNFPFYVISPIYKDYSLAETTTYSLMYDPTEEYSSSDVSRNVIPTLYLSDDVYIITGTGTKTNPYIISNK